MFKLSKKPLNEQMLKTNLNKSGSGASVCFEGIVRDHNEDRPVLALEYEAYEALAVLEAGLIFEEASRKFQIRSAVCCHRVGYLRVGETAVWIGVTSAHRDTAFKACRYIIDELKKRLPIWKKEHYADGNSGWINCECPH